MIGDRELAEELINKLLHNSSSFLMWHGIGFHPFREIVSYNQDVAVTTWALREKSSKVHGY